MKLFRIYIIFLILFISCDQAAKSNNNVDHLTEVRDYLYEANSGDLFFRTKAKLEMAKRECELQYGSIYSTTEGEIVDLFRGFFSSPWLIEHDSELKYLVDYVDKNTWRQISPSYYLDRNNVYFHSRSNGASGGYLRIVENIKPDEFYLYSDSGWRLANELHQNVEKTQWYVSNGKSVFYESRVLGNVDLNTFKVMPKIDGFANGAVAVDKHGFYDLGEKMGVEEVLETIHEFKKSGEIKKEKLASLFETLLAYYKSLQTK